MEKDQIIKDAQYRKGLSIAFFNATNNAMQIIQSLNKDFKDVDLKIVQNEIVFWRDWLLEEHKNYYATVIANIGQNYNAQETIKKLEATKTLEDLKMVWLLLSADERHDKEIIKVAKKLRAKYEKA